MKKKLAITGVIMCLFLTACGEKVYTVDQMLNNQKIYDTFKQKCENGELREDSQNCQNFRKAARAKWLQPKPIKIKEKTFSTSGSIMDGV